MKQDFIKTTLKLKKFNKKPPPKGGECVGG
jgi:hypothetical protein